MIYNRKDGDYKFPGGGLKDGEELEEALIREVREETGLVVIKDSIRYIGRTEEIRKGRTDDVLETISHYFTCRTEEEAVERNLDEYEKEYGYTLQFVTLEEAAQNNEQVLRSKDIPWIQRDTLMLRKLLNWEDAV